MWAGRQRRCVVLKDVWQQVRGRREEPPAGDVPVDRWARATVRDLINLVADGNEDRPLVVHPWDGRVVAVDVPEWGDDLEAGEWPGTAGVLSFAATCARVLDRMGGWLLGDRYHPVSGDDLQDELTVMASWAPVRVEAFGGVGWVHRLPREIQWGGGVNVDPVPQFVVMGPTPPDRPWVGSLEALRVKSLKDSLRADWWWRVVDAAEGMT